MKCEKVDGPTFDMYEVGARCDSEETGPGDIRVNFPYDQTYKLFASKGWFHVDHEWVEAHLVDGKLYKVSRSLYPIVDTITEAIEQHNREAGDKQSSPLCDRYNACRNKRKDLKCRPVTDFCFK